MANPSIKLAYRIFSGALLVALLIVFLMILTKGPAPRVSNDPAAAARVQQKFAAADYAKSSGQPAPTVTLDSSELNSYLSQNLQTEGSVAAATPQPGSTTAAPPTSGQPSDPNAALNSDGATLEQVQSSVKDVKVDMVGDLVKAYVVFDFHGKDLSLELDGHLGSQDGYMKFEPVAGKLGEMPLPQGVLQQAVDKMMASPENREKLRLPDDINSLQIVDGKAVVSYK
jgi:hypothetical protein